MEIAKERMLNQVFGTGDHLVSIAFLPSGILLRIVDHLLLIHVYGFGMPFVVSPADIDLKLSDFDP